MITTAHALLSEEPDCDADRMREVLSGNHLPLHRLYLDRRGGARCARRLQRRLAIAMKLEHLHRHADGTPRGSALPARARRICRRSRGRRPAPCRDPAQLGRARAHRLPRCIARPRTLPGVHAVITAADMPGGPPIIPMRLQPLPEFKPYEQPVIAHDKVRYVGEPIAVVLAQSAAIAEDALEAIALEIEALPAVADWHDGGEESKPAVRSTGTNRSLVFQARKGDADAAFANAPYVRREQLRTGRHYGLTLEPRGVMAQWDAAKGKLTVSGAAKVPFFNRRILAKQIGLPEDADRHDRERRRRRLRRARRVLPGRFPDPVRGAPRQPPGEMDRGPPREPHGDEPRARGGGRPRDRLRARRHHPGAARPGPHRHGRLYAHQRRGRRRATSRSSWPGPIACRTSRSTRRCG